MPRCGSAPMAVPVNWHFKPEEIKYILKDSGNVGSDRPCRHAASVARRDPRWRDRAQRSDAAGDTVRTTRSIPIISPRPISRSTLKSWLEQQAPYDGPALPQPQNMIYTSGTTGHPKGVAAQRADAGADRLASERMRALIYGLRPGVRALLPGPLYHSAPNSFGLRAGRLGGALVLMPRFEPEEFLRLIEAKRIDTIFMVPTMFIRLMKLPEAVRRQYDMSSLRHVIHAAAPCPADVKRAMIEWWGPVIHEYLRLHRIRRRYLRQFRGCAEEAGHGRRESADGVELRFVGDDGKLLPQGEIGEIYSRIAGNPDFTYHNKPEKRAEIERDGFITSGDVGYIDGDGYVFICDRKRDMVISGGVNIYPAEIEAALHAVPGVHDCAVFGIPDDEFGEAADGGGGTAAGRDAGHRCHPRAAQGVTCRLQGAETLEIQADLPREDSGKIFKRRLRDPYWARAGRSI